MAKKYSGMQRRHSTFNELIFYLYVANNIFCLLIIHLPKNTIDVKMPIANEQKKKTSPNDFENAYIRKI